MAEIFYFTVSVCNISSDWCLKSGHTYFLDQFPLLEVYIYNTKWLMSQKWWYLLRVKGLGDAQLAKTMPTCVEYSSSWAIPAAGWSDSTRGRGVFLDVHQLLINSRILHSKPISGDTSLSLWRLPAWVFLVAQCHSAGPLLQVALVFLLEAGLKYLFTRQVWLTYNIKSFIIIVFDINVGSNSFMGFSCGTVP